LTGKKETQERGGESPGAKKEDGKSKAKKAPPACNGLDCKKKIAGEKQKGELSF